MMISELLNIGSKIIDRVIPDPEQKQEAKMELLRLQQEGQTRDLEVSMSAIVMEAQSKDKWTSRARPAFLYVMYIYILSALPFGVLFAFSPEAGINVTEGLRLFLAAIPSEMWALFGAGYLGYTTVRSMDKAKIAKLKEGAGL